MIANLGTRAAEIRDAQTAEDLFRGRGFDCYELRHASLSNALKEAQRDLCTEVPLEGRSGRSWQSLVVMLLFGFRNKDLSFSIQKAAIPELHSLTEIGFGCPEWSGLYKRGETIRYPFVEECACLWTPVDSGIVLRPCT